MGEESSDRHDQYDNNRPHDPARLQNFCTAALNVGGSGCQLPISQLREAEIGLACHLIQRGQQGKTAEGRGIEQQGCEKSRSSAEHGQDRCAPGIGRRV